MFQKKAKNKTAKILFGLLVGIGIIYSLIKRKVKSTDQNSTAATKTNIPIKLRQNIIPNTFDKFTESFK